MLRVKISKLGFWPKNWKALVLIIYILSFDENFRRKRGSKRVDSKKRSNEEFANNIVNKTFSKIALLYSP